MLAALALVISVLAWLGLWSRLLLWFVAVMILFWFWLWARCEDMGGVFVAGEGDVGEVVVHARGFEHKGAVHRCALGFVNGGGITVVNMRGGAQAQRARGRLAVKHQRQRGLISIHRGHGALHPVAQAALRVVLGDHKALAHRNGAGAVGGGNDVVVS